RTGLKARKLYRQAFKLARRVLTDLRQGRRWCDTLAGSYHRHDQRFAWLDIVLERQNVSKHAPAGVVTAPDLLASGPRDFALGEFAPRPAGVFLQFVGAVERWGIDRRVQVDADAESIDWHLRCHHRS